LNETELQFLDKTVRLYNWSIVAEHIVVFDLAKRSILARWWLFNSKETLCLEFVYFFLISVSEINTKKIINLLSTR